MILKNLFSKVVVDAFVKDPGIYSLFPIVESIKSFPSWWKNLPQDFLIYPKKEFPIHVIKASTIKRCPGFIELYKKSFTIPLWGDTSISTKENGEWIFSSVYRNMNITSHDRQQFGNMFDNFIHMKIDSPWLIKEKRGINFLTQFPIWNNIDFWNVLHVVPGFFEFKHQSSTNINLFVNRINQNIQLTAGTPIQTLIPMTEKNVVLKCHLLDEKEFNKIGKTSTDNFMFTKRIKRMKKILEEQSK